MGMNEADLAFLGLARRAGKLALGEENSRRAVRSGKAEMILLASDAAPNALARGEELARRAGIPLIKLEGNKNRLAEALGSPLFAIAAVCDAGFAEALQKRLG